MKSLKNKMAKMAIAACLIGAIVLVWGRKEIVNEKSAKNEKLLRPKQLKFRKMRDYIFQWGQMSDKQYFGVQA